MATETIELRGHDAQGNSVTKTLTIQVADPTTRRVGMSSPADQWDTRLGEVGRPGVTVRRIFCDLTSSGQDQASLINAAVADGMQPMVSYKVPSVTNAIAGSYDAWMTNAANFLNGLGVTVYATVWHEPYPDMTGAEFLALHRRLIPLLKRTRVKVGPILNTWVLDNANNWPAFDDYVADDLLTNGTYDFFGFDSYQSGTLASPGSKSLATRYSTVVSRLTAHGNSTIPFLIGEFNAWENTTFTSCCNTVANNDRIAVACVFNSSVGDKGNVLTGSLLTTFKNLKANAKFAQ